jgi:hypothetical protein
LLQAVPMLKRQIEGTTRESISLKNNIAIEIHTSRFDPETLQDGAGRKTLCQIRRMNEE